MSEWWRRFVFPIRLLSSRNRRAAEEELEEEIRSHLEIEAQENIEAGMTPEEARDAARRRFGNVGLFKQDTRDSWGIGPFERLWQDIRYGARMLAKKRLVTAVAVLSLGLGIGANTAVFTILKAALYGAPPLYQDVHRLVTVWETPPREPGERRNASPPNYLAWEGEEGIFESVAAVRYLPVSVRFEDYPVQMDAQAASASLLPTLGVRPLLGRNFLTEEESLDADPVAILGYGLWQSRFGGDPEIIGETITIDSRDYTIVGVMPRGFWFAHGINDLWMPLRLSQRRWSLDDRRLRVVAKLRQGVSVEEAEARLEALAPQLEESFPGSDQGWGVRLDLVRGIDALGGDIPPGILQLIVALGLILLIACTNIAAVMVSRGTARQTETAVRSALGAGRLRLIRQLLTESLLLSGLGCAVSVMMTFGAVHLLTVYLPGDLARTLDVRVDGPIFAFAILVSVITGLFSGIAPALADSRVDVNKVLKEGSGGLGGNRQRLRGALIVVEAALTMVLLVGVGLLVKGFVAVRGLDPGFDQDRLVAFRVELPESEYLIPFTDAVSGDPDLVEVSPRVSLLFDDLVQSLEQLPEVDSATAAAVLPPWAGTDRAFTLAEPIQRGDQAPPTAGYNPVSQNFFDTLGARLLRGRTFSTQDTESSNWVVIINDAMARRYWPNESAVGQQIRIESEERSRTVAGVVSDLRNQGMSLHASPEMYVPYVQQPDRCPAQRGASRLDMSFVVRAHSGPENLGDTIRRAVAELDSGLALSGLTTMQERLDAAAMEMLAAALLNGPIIVLALALTAVGIYGVLSFSVSRRVQEIGIRIAMGAGRFRLLKLIIGHGLKLVGAGIALGLLGSLALSRILSSMLLDVVSIDPLLLAGASTVLVLLALAAGYVPARRAAKVDPVVALRYE